MKRLSIQSCRIENLRGYSEATLDFKPFMALVGENNEGKSSIVKMMEFLLLVADDDLLKSRRTLNLDEERLWLPANRENHRSRRLTLRIAFENGRYARKYKKVGDKEVVLRFSITRHDKKARLNYGPPRRNEAFDERAIELLSLIKENYEFVVLPAVRDAKSSTFEQRLATRVNTEITSKLRHTKQAGAPIEYRKALSALNNLKWIVSTNKKEIDIAGSLSILARMVNRSEIRLDAEVPHLGDWIAKHLKLAISTGEHDELLVSPDQVGNGLQSVIDIALAVGNRTSPDKALFLIVEEPEAFLHPSAQRSLIVGLKEDLNFQKDVLLITTHSPIVIDECKYPDTVLVRKRKFYTPGEKDDKRRIAINTNLLSVPHAECFFANLVLLVEGPGDRAFFGTLLHRLRKLKTGHLLSKLVVQETGGKDRFGPWLNLFRSYGKEGDRPIEWLALFDGDAASNESGSRSIVRALRDSGESVSQTIESALIAFGDIDYSNPQTKQISVDTLNVDLAILRSRLFSIDCEWAICGGNLPKIQLVLDEVFREIGSDHQGDPIAQARALGSKVFGPNVVNRPRKDEFIRSMIAERLPLDSIPPEIRSVLEIVLKKLLSAGETQALFDEAAKVNPQF